MLTITGDILGRQDGILQELASEPDLGWRRSGFRQIEEEKTLQVKRMAGTKKPEHLGQVPAE